jgi:hypothetical protein
MRRVVLGALALLAMPTTAAAYSHQQTIAPPGNSGVQQYVETIPTAHGGQPTSSVHEGGGPGHPQGGGSGPAGGGPGGGSAISSSTQRALDSQGTTGRAAAAFIRATAPSGARSTTRASGNGSTNSNGAHGNNGSNAASTRGGGASPASSVFHSLTGVSGNGGLGALLPIILVGSLLVMAGLAIVRRRRTT